ncbi:MAG TPA: TolC family protein [Gemmataceae bacterium]|nr:TolC family protein [Gemmataceae bacterium]
MRFPILTRSSKLPRCCRFAGYLCPALLALALGCAEHQPFSTPQETPTVRPQMPEELPRVLPPISPTKPNVIPPISPTRPAVIPPISPTRPTVLPPLIQETGPAPAPAPAAKLGFAPIEQSKQVPINLDSVLRLADSQNWHTMVAREKLQEAFANCDVAAKAWLPDLWVGAGWYRHEGGAANPDGTPIVASFGSMFAGAEVTGRLDLREAVYRKVDACRQLWQQKAEVSKLSNEALMEASTAYVDLLAARAAETVALQMQAHLEDLLKQAVSIAKQLPAAEVEVARVQTEFHGQQQLVRKFREASVAAGAKLIYLLGLDPASELAIMDRSLTAFTLINANVSGEELVAQAEQNGPAIRELEGLLQLVNEASANSQGLSQLMPVFDLRVAEGGFGTGPGDQMTWDNRFDLGMQMRWNLTEWASRRDRQRVTEARISQVNATYQDVRAKLTMGVQESREAVLSGRDQMDIGVKQLKHASDSYERSKFRLKEAPNIKDRSPSEVLLSIRALNAANLAYLMAIRDYDKAQLRLAILTGAIGSKVD